MEYQKKELGSYNLHMIQTDKFKTITVRIVFRKPIIKEEITIRNFLSDMLMLSSKDYPTKRALAIKAQDLYEASIGATNYRLGNYINTNFYLTILNEKYTEKGMLEKSIQFFHDMLFKPNVTNQAFDEQSFKIVKTQTELAIQSMKEDSAQYSVIRLLENMEPDSPLSYRGYGYLEDIENITPSTLYDFYKDMLKSNMVDIFVIGNINFYEIEKLIRENFEFVTLKRTRMPSVIECNKVPKKIKTITEQDDITQAKLAIGCRTVNLTQYERNYPLTIYNILLGGGSDSKLFTEVREKNSLAYTVRSVPNKLDNLLLITAGIAKENFKKAVKLIEEEMKKMEKGEFNEEDIEKAKQFYVTALEESTDSPGRIIDSYYMMELLGTDDIETKKKKMLKVTTKEIVEVAKKVKIDTIYLLEGKEIDEEG